jgi:hypothetical protein
MGATARTGTGSAAGNPGVSSRVAIRESTRIEHGSTTLGRSTVEQLRDDIDHGRTCDKIDAPDPAVAPLGADEEAAGTPPDPAAVDAARALEGSRPCRPASHRGAVAAWLPTAFAVALGAGLVGWMLWLHG